MRKLTAPIAAAAVLGGCSMQADVKTAEGAVAAFHQEVNSERYDAVYAASGPEMKAAATSARLAQLLSAVHRKLGLYVSGVRSTWNVNYGTAGKIVTLVYASKYARGDAAERFVFRVNGATTSLLGYNVDSQAMLVN